MVAGRAAAWWREWLSDRPGDATAGGTPSRIVLFYRDLSASVSRHAIVADTAEALALAASALPQLTHLGRQDAAMFGPALLFSALLVVPLIWRRRFPLSAFAFAAVVALAQWIAGVQLTADVTLLVYLYTVASRYPLRVGVLAAGVVEAGVVMASARWHLTGHWIDSVLLLTGPVAASLLLGVSVRHRRSSLSALTERAAQLERERDQQAAISAAAERTRIAREMHDVVAHSVSVMVTLSDGAALKQATEPDRATLAMRQVSATGRQALDEMRRLLGVLRTDDTPGSRQPQPGMAQLDGLFDQVRATGLSAGLTVTGTPAPLPPGAELTVYRIVQEALTNTLKHAADPTRVSVTIACRPGSVTVEVQDDGGPGHVRAAPRTAGHGLTGMRERAAVYGGTVSAGPGPAGGWQVRVHLPMPDGPGATAVRPPATQAGPADLSGSDLMNRNNR
jgi:signal transduction histidine kinase